MSSQKNISFALVLLCLFFATSHLRAQAPAATAAPDAGKVEGNTYTNPYFGFSYRMPEGWVVRATGGRMAGPGGNLLLMLKRKSGDALSSIMVSATELPADYRNDVSRYLLDRYRLNQSVSSGLTLNGRSMGRSTVRGGADPELVTVAEHTYYRVEFESAAVSRTVMATLEKGYVVIFEIVSPSREGEQAGRELVDSIYAVTYATPDSIQRSERK